MGLRNKPRRQRYDKKSIIAYRLQKDRQYVFVTRNFYQSAHIQRCICTLQYSKGTQALKKKKNLALVTCVVAAS